MKFFVGLDLSLVKTGIAILNEKSEVVNIGLVTSKKEGETPECEMNRLMEIRTNIFRKIDETKNMDTDNGDALFFAIEGIAYLAKSTSLVQLAALNYLVREWIMYDENKFVIVAPLTLKRFATGKGNAEKDHMILEAYKQYGLDNIDNNEADALFLANVSSVLFGKEKERNKIQEETINLLKKQI